MNKGFKRKTTSKKKRTMGRWPEMSKREHIAHERDSDIDIPVPKVSPGPSGGEGLLLRSAQPADWPDDNIQV